MHGNARSSPLGRLGMVLRVIEEGEPVTRVARRCGPVPAVRVQVGAPLPGRRPSRFGGSVVAAALLPYAHRPEVEEQALQARRTLRLWECDPLTGEPLKTLSRAGGAI